MDRKTLTTLVGSWSLGTGPLYYRLAQALEKAILQGDLPSGTRLPAERLLAQDLAVSRSTVVAAYALLQQKNLIESRHGSGTWVQSLPIEKTAAYRSTSNGALARSPLFETLLGEPHEMIDLTTSTSDALPGLSVEAFALPPHELAAVLEQRGYAPLGLLDLRQAIAHRFRQTGLPTTPNQVMVTTGAQQAITLAAALYIQRGDTVVLENPTYFGALDVFRALGARLLPIPMDQSGLRVDALRRILETCFPRLIFLTPTFHNPTGMVLSEGRRREVARLATEFGVPLVEDNAFADLVITHEGPAPIASYAKDETIVITIGSMNKLFWQGLRIGWLRAPEVVISRLGRLKVIADLGTGFISQAIALRLMPHIDRIKAFRHQELTLQLDLLTALLQEHLPSWTWRRPDGGYFLWVRLPYGDAREFAQVALRYQVVVTPGTAMSVDESYVDYLRLPFLLDAEVLRRGVERLAQAWNVYTQLAHDNNRPINVLV